MLERTHKCISTRCKIYYTHESEMKHSLPTHLNTGSVVANETEETVRSYETFAVRKNSRYRSCSDNQKCPYHDEILDAMSSAFV